MTLVRLSIAWLVGIGLGTQLNVPAVPLVAVSGALALTLVLGATRIGRRVDARARILVALTLCASLGAYRARLAEPRLGPDHVSSLNDQGSRTLRGRIVAEPAVRDRGTDYRVAVEAVWGGGSGVAAEKTPVASPAPERTRATNPPASSWQPVRGLVLVQAPRFPPHAYGDTVVVTATLETPPVLDQFDYRAWLATRGIHSLARRARVTTVARGGGNPVRRGLIALRTACRRTLAASLPEPEAALATGILLGDDDGIPKPVADAFKTTNTSHVIAISGSNIALLVALLMATCGPLLGKRRAVPVVLAVLVAYTTLVGADAAVVRAAVMGGITVFGVLLGRPSQATVALMAAAWAMTAYRPSYIEDLGFQLSFAATVGLIVFSTRLTERAETLFARGIGGARAQAVVRLTGEAVIVTLAAQVTTWPLIAFHTGAVSLVGLAANFLVVPAQPAVMGLGGLATVAGIAWSPAGRVLGALAWLPLAYTIRVVELAARVPLASITWTMPLSLLALYYAVLALTAWPRACQALRDGARRVASGVHDPGAAPALVGRLTSGWTPVAALGAAVALTWTAALARPDGLLHLFALDVGQGDALLVVTPSGRRMLVDGGPVPSAVLAGLGRHLPPWDRRLDVVVLTHPDADHVGGLAAVLERYDVATVIVPPTRGTAPDAAAWRAALAGEGAAVVTGTAGVRVALDETGGVRADVLWPPPSGPGTANEDVNARSVVLRLAHGRVTMLLPGDIEADTEARLLAGGAPLDADVLKVAHHGSDTSTTPPFLAAVSPALAVVSVGAENKFGHPSPSVLARLGAVTVRRTDQAGTVEAVSDGRAVWVR
jgi:competence protein ComEC